MKGMTSPADAPRTRRIEPRLHEPVEDRPYYDVDLDVPHSRAHMAMISDLSSIFRVLSEELGLCTLSDNSVWFMDPRDDAQRVSFPDLVLLEPDTDASRATAEDALFVGEVVSTEDRRKEVKDTAYQLALCEYNEVPEFALFFPEVGDARALTFHRLVQGRYDALVVSPGATVVSNSVPGLALRVLPKALWRPGRKVEVFYRGEVRHPLDEERLRAEREHQRAEEERQRAEDERQRADALAARLEQAEALLARLGALGVDVGASEDGD